MRFKPLTPITKEKLIRVGIVSAITGTAAGTVSYIQLKKQDKFWRRRDQRWRELMDSALRIVDIQRDESLTAEERDKKIDEEFAFIKLTKRYVED
jgi:hypothetical protein